MRVIVWITCLLQLGNKSGYTRGSWWLYCSVLVLIVANQLQIGMIHNQDLKSLSDRNWILTVNIFFSNTNPLRCIPWTATAGAVKCATVSGCSLKTYHQRTPLHRSLHFRFSNSKQQERQDYIITFGCRFRTEVRMERKNIKPEQNKRAIGKNNNNDQ